MKRIVCATDFSATSEAAVAEAERLAGRLDAELVLLHVAVEAPLWREGVYTPEVRKVFESQRQWAATTLAARAAALGANGVRGRVLVTSGLPWREIIDTARDEGAELIVIGTHGRSGLNRMLLGSVAERVVRQAPCPVMTVGPEARQRASGELCGNGPNVREILFPTDFSAVSAAAGRTAADFARHFGAGLHVLYVVPSGFDVEAPRPALDDAVAALGAGLTVTQLVESGVAAPAIVAYARAHRIDLIVMGTHGRTGFSQALLGSITEAVVRRAPCCVLTVPAAPVAGEAPERKWSEEQAAR